MDIQQPPIDTVTIEGLVRRVRGVLAVRIVQNQQGQIDELHVVASPERSAKQMVRDVESIIFVRAGLRLDHRKISLVQVDESSIQPVLTRVQLLNVAYTTDSSPPVVTIELAYGNRRLQGIGHAPPEQPALSMLLAGQATGSALAQLIGARGQLQVEHVDRQAFGQLQVCMAHLLLTTEDGIETLLGISAVRGGDELTAAVRATLDAANRRVQRLMGGG